MSEFSPRGSCQRGIIKCNALFDKRIAGSYFWKLKEYY